MTDREIIELYLKRDENGIRETERLYGRRLTRIAETLLSKEDAEECVSDTYLAAWNHIPPDEPASLMPYLAKILRNLSRNRLRDLNARKRSAEFVEFSDELADLIPDPKADTEVEAIHAVRDALNHFLETQSREKQDLFTLHFWYGLSVQEAADHMGISFSKADKALTRLKKKLRAALLEEFPDMKGKG